jgi:hypothetical protein
MQATHDWKIAGLQIYSCGRYRGRPRRTPRIIHPDEHNQPVPGAFHGDSYMFDTFRCMRRNAGKLKTTPGKRCSVALASTKVGHLPARLPPSTRDILKSEWLPQTRHLSCGLSLTQSQSAHKTAFCKATALKGRIPSTVPALSESRIAQPPTEPCSIVSSSDQEKQGIQRRKSNLSPGC